MSKMTRKERRTFFMRLGAVLIVICMVAALALPAFAADTSGAVSQSDPYTYTVRIFPGDKGTIDGSESPVIVSGIQPGYRWNSSDFDWAKRTASKTAKYHPTGIREAGKDNNTKNRYASFVVDRDIDLVVSYGITGSETQYTIYYREAGTEALLEVPEGHSNPETYYGNVNDSPVVSYLHIEGYTPQYYNLTGTLKKNAADNVWTFYYNPIVVEQPTEPETESGNTTGTTTGGTTTTTGGTTTTTSGGTTTRTTTTTTGGTTGGTTTGGTTTGGTTGGTTTGGGTATGGTGTATGGTGTATGGTGTATGGTGTAAGGTGTGTGTGTTVANAGNANQNTGPQEIVNVDEQQTPLAEYQNSGTGSTEQGAGTTNPETEGVVRARGIGTPAKIIIALLIIAVLGGAGWFLFRRFAQEDDEDDDEEE